MLIRFQNQGEKIAKHINFQEILPDLLPINMEKAVFTGDIFSRTKNDETVEYIVSTMDPSLLRYPRSIDVPYQDTNGQQYMAHLEPSIARFEYEFPKPEIIGRDEAITEIDKSLSALWDLSLRRTNASGAPVLIIEGQEGEGKTRLLRLLELRAQHSNHMYRLVWLDSEVIRTHMRELVLNLLETKELEEPSQIEAKLKVWFPLPKEQKRVDSLMTFLGWGSEPLTPNTLERIKADVVLLLLKISAVTPLIIIFDNLHLPPQEGVDLAIFKHVIGTIGSSNDYPILICMSFRPLDTGQPEWVSDIGLPPSLSRKITLDRLTDPQITSLVMEVMPYPRLSDEVRDLIVDRAEGNPLYAIEMLRFLINSKDELLVVRNGEWWLGSSYDEIFKDRELMPGSIQYIIEQRFNNELRNDPELQGLLLRLSVIGYNFPLSLIEQLCRVWYPNRDWRYIQIMLHRAVVFGFLIHLGEIYQFSHTEKREVLYKITEEGEPNRLDIRTQIAQVLLSEPWIYADPIERMQQLGRHLIRAHSNFAKNHIEAIVQAAETEMRKLAFRRSLKRYEAALSYLDHNDPRYTEILLEISRINIVQGNLDKADQLLVDALANSQKLIESGGERKLVGTRVLVGALHEQIHVLVKRSKLVKALDIAEEVRYLIEGFWGYRLIQDRLFHHSSLDYSSLIDLYSIVVFLANESQTSSRNKSLLLGE